MRIAPVVAFAALVAATGIGEAAAIVRCEGADGRVTYSNTECPPEAKAVRKVDLSPPVIVNDGAAPPAKGGERAPARLQPARDRSADDPIRFDQELNAQLAAQRRECEAKLREIQRVADEFDASEPPQRASAELALRRAQDDYRALCPRQR